MSERVLSGSQKCYHILGSAVFMVGWEINDSLFFNNISTAPENVQFDTYFTVMTEKTNISIYDHMK